MGVRLGRCLGVGVGTGANMTCRGASSSIWGSGATGSGFETVSGAGSVIGCSVAGCSGVRGAGAGMKGTKVGLWSSFLWERRWDDLMG